LDLALAPLAKQLDGLGITAAASEEKGRALLAQLESIEESIPPEVDLRPLLEALAATDLSVVSVLERLGGAQAETSRNIQDASELLMGEVQKMDGSEHIQRVLQVLQTMQDAARSALEARPPVDLEPVFEKVVDAEKRTRADVEAVLQAVGKIEVRPRVDLDPILKAVLGADPADALRRLDSAVAASAALLEQVDAMMASQTGMLAQLTEAPKRSLMWATPSAVW